jgi:AcrR family transcriptional regulator
MSTNSASAPPATRRRGDDARAEAIVAARALLAEGGPSAVTLKAVGARMGVGHANLIHHFGSAAGLQAALMDRVVRDLAERIAGGLEALQPGELGQRKLLDAVFDAFGSGTDQGGAAELAAALVLAREGERAAGLAEVVRDLAVRVARLAGGDAEAQAKATGLVLTAAYMAFADALIGPILGDMLGVSRDYPRQLALSAGAAVLTGPVSPDQGAGKP